jgi:hypothetical protein
LFSGNENHQRRYGWWIDLIKLYGLGKWVVMCNICHYVGEIANCAIFRNVGLCIAIMRMKVHNAVLVRGEFGPVEFKVFVMVVSLKNKEKQNT